MKKVIPLFLLLFIVGCSKTVVPYNYKLYDAFYQRPSLGEARTVSIYDYVYSEGIALHSEVIYINEPFVSKMFSNEYTVEEGYYSKMGEDDVNEYYGVSYKFRPMGNVTYSSNHLGSRAIVYNKNTWAFSLDIGSENYTSPVYGIDFKKETLAVLSSAKEKRSISFQGYYDGVIRFVYEEDKEYGESRHAVFELKYPEEDQITINGCELIVTSVSESELVYLVSKGFDK